MENVWLVEVGQLQKVLHPLNRSRVPVAELNLSNPTDPTVSVNDMAFCDYYDDGSLSL